MDYFLINHFGENSTFEEHSILIIETIVNIILIMFALNSKGIIKTILLAAITTFGTFIAAYNFETVNVYYTYFTPILLIANLIVIVLIKYLLIDREFNFFVSVIPGLIIKSYLVANSFTIIRKIGFVSARRTIEMKGNWLIEELIALVISVIITFIIYKIEYRKDLIR